MPASEFRLEDPPQRPLLVRMRALLPELRPSERRIAELFLDDALAKVAAQALAGVPVCGLGVVACSGGRPAGEAADREPLTRLCRKALEGRCRKQQVDGLQREMAPDGCFEPLGPQHSWNSGNRMNNAALFNMGRHSDHHCNGTRHFQQLRPIEGAPELPSGYAAAMLTALVPRAWRRVMDPRANAVRNEAGR